MSHVILDAPLLPLCRHAVEVARAAGANEAEAFASHSTTVKARAEQNDLAGAESDTSLALGLRVLVKGAVGFCALNRVDDASLELAAKTAVALARAGTPEDGPSLPVPNHIPDLRGMVDQAVAAASVDDAVERCHALLQALQAVDARVRVDGCDVSFSSGRQAVASSRGVAAEAVQTVAAEGAFGFAADGDDVASFDGESNATISLTGLHGVAMGKELGERLMRMLGAQAFDGQPDACVVLGPDAFAEILLGPILDSLDGESVRLGKSRLGKELGTLVASKLLTVVDDPLLDGDASSEAFDREGLGHTRCVLVGEGVARTLMHNWDSARRMGQAPTAHASGSPNGLPGIGTSRLVVDAGTTPLKDILADAGDGLYVGRFAGNVDPVSGDFSGVAKCGFRIRAGALAEPVNETMLAGNAFDVLKRLRAISAERKASPGQVLPHVLVDGVSISSGG